MSGQQGQTDQVLKVKLESKLILARWLDSDVAVNGEAALEVSTLYVGHGAPVKITIKDSEGGTAGTLEGEVLQNVFRARYKPDGKAAGKTLFFEAELPKHGLKGKSGGLRVGTVVKIENPRWLDGKAKPAEKAARGASLVLKADLKEGPPAGSVHIKISYQIDESHPPARLCELRGIYQDRKFEFPWLADVKPPTSQLETDLTFEIRLAGTSSGVSGKLKYLDIDFKYSQ